jgi:hypothetical protein
MSLRIRVAGVCAVAVVATVTGLCAGPANEGRQRATPAIASQWKDVPFRATQVIVRRGPAGVVETRGLVARNSAGSTYVEMIDEATQATAEVLIFDVPHHRELVLDMPNRRYKVVAAPGLEGREPPADFVADQLRVAAAEKDSSVHRVSNGVDSTWKGLGVRRVSGLETIGSVQVRRPLPAPGEALDGPAEVDERWLSVDLGVAVQRIKHDPISDEDTEITLTEVLRSEPDEQLFLVPKGFVLESSDGQLRRPQAR